MVDRSADPPSPASDPEARAVQRAALQTWDRLVSLLGPEQHVVVLTGAGISTESGIPDFRGNAGYWTEGSIHHVPQELATFATYRRRPALVWGWYLHRLGVCRAAQPNAAHQAIAAWQAAWPGRVHLITQNVDGLHLRAGSPLDQTYSIHGAIEFMRCSADTEHRARLVRIPDDWARARLPTDPSEVPPEIWQQLRCDRCQAPMRPHVLWFDECYDEELFFFHSSQQAARKAAVLLSIGTTGQTNLPLQLGQVAAHAGAALFDLNLERNVFSDWAEQTGGAFLCGAAAQVVPRLVQTALRGSAQPPAD